MNNKQIENSQELSREKKKKILLFSLKAGELMMKNGAEIYRVEDTVSRICKACGIPYAEVFVTMTGIFISLDDGKAGTEVYTFQKRIRGVVTDLEKISKINQLSRDLVNGELTLEDGEIELNNIEKIETYHMAIRTLGAGLAASFFCLMFGGNLKDFIATAFIGSFCYIFMLMFEKIEANYFIKGFCATATATFLTLLSIKMGIGENMDPMIIGILMIFVPGVAITNAIRDFLTGDTLSGIARAVEAFFIAISLAVGAGVILRLSMLVGGIL